MNILSEEFQQQLVDSVADQVSKTFSVMSDKAKKRYLRYSKEAPSYCCVSQGTFNTWVVEYQIPVSIIGGVKIVDTNDLDQFISKHKI
ncbi:hypothetical protein SDC9_83485 [bioreactor metagenome]|uniref:Helix-turn-helix domain-containing protein n=1 Tax=bioreactor metagenome TaxID=1076179 RepID=A0A644ZA84_9ZZZZ